MNPPNAKMRPSPRILGIAFALYVAFYLLLFGRALLAGGPIVLGDSQTEYLPQFRYAHTTWTSLLFSGYPLAADPQNATFSPTRLVFAALGWWNAYAISAPIIASTLAFLYALEVAESFAGALVAGLVFGANGYFLPNLHLTPMLQTAAWVPLLLWSLERLVREPRASVAFVGAGAIALMIFGGYPQPAAYALVIAGLYALVGVVRVAPAARRAYVGAGLATFAGGLALAAVQLVPTAELLLRSERTAVDYGQFAGWAWVPRQWTELFLPRAFLGKWATAPAMCGVSPDADHASFSLVALFAGGVGAFATRRRATTRLWLGVLAFSLAFAFGDDGLLAKLLYHVPPYDKFRDPVRHMVYFGLGLSVLAAHGVAAVERRLTSGRVLAVGGVSMAVMLGVATLLGCTSPGSAAAIAGWAIAAFGAAAIVLLQRRQHAWPVVVAVVAVDLATFDGVGYASPILGGHPIAAPGYFDMRPHVEATARALGESKQRILASRGQVAPADEIPVNASLLWNVPSAAGYSPIAPVQSLEAVGAAYFGAPIHDWWSPDDRSLDVAAVRYVTLPEPRAVAETKRGIPWYPNDLGFRVDARAPELDIALPDGAFHRVALDADLWASLDVEQDAVVATIDGEAVRAGVDVAEWAIGCPGIQTRHRRADVLETRAARLPQGTCAWNRYLVTRSGTFAHTLHVRWTGGDRAALRIHRVTVDDEPVVPSFVALTHDPRWRLRPAGPAALLAENTRALPRAWTVAARIAVPRPLDVMRSGRLPSGDAWDPRRSALVTTDVADEALDPRCEGAAVTWRRDENIAVELEVTSPARCYLVLADTEYPGWHATVDGRPIAIDRVNHGYRGVFVPEGTHRVRFTFASGALQLGAAIGFAALCAFAFALVLASRTRAAPRLTAVV